MRTFSKPECTPSLSASSIKLAVPRHQQMNCGPLAQSRRKLCLRYQRVPVLSKDSVICVLSPSPDHEDRRCSVSDHLPFWVGTVLEDEEAPVDTYGKQLHPIDPEDAFQVQWLGVFVSTVASPTARARELAVAMRASGYERISSQAGHNRLSDTIKREAILFMTSNFQTETE
eukprot:3400712-Pleurochrysis_carterae.AAC.2